MANCHHYLSGDKSAQTLTSENVASNTASKPERSYPSPKENHDHHAASEGSAARIPPPRPPPPKLRGPSLIYKPNISSSSISKANPKIALNNSVASSSAASQSSNDSRANAARDIEDEIGLLETLIGSMQKEVEDKQNCFKQDMQDLSSKFQDGICIPPMPRKIWAGTMHRELKDGGLGSQDVWWLRELFTKQSDLVCSVCICTLYSGTLELRLPMVDTKVVLILRWS